MKRAPSHISMSVLKTVCNAWTTTHRMHEVNRSMCIFGCTSQVDSLVHYLRCPVLAMPVSVALRDPLPIPSPNPSFFLPPPLTSRKDILRLFISFHTYHSVRNSRSNIDVHRYLITVRTAIAACHSASNMGYEVWPVSRRLSTRPHYVMGVAAPPAAATVSNTRFVPGGDHFMTTSYSSIAIER